MKYILVEMATAKGEQVPHIVYLGEFSFISEAIAAKIIAGRNNPGMAFSFMILAVME